MVFVGYASGMPGAWLMGMLDWQAAQDLCKTAYNMLNSLQDAYLTGVLGLQAALEASENAVKINKT